MIMTVHLRAAVYSLFLHGTAVLGVFLCHEFGESPEILASEYITITAVNIVSENFKAQSASSPDVKTKISAPSEEAPGEPVGKHIEEPRDSKPPKIVATQRKIGRHREVSMSYKAEATARKHERRVVVPHAEQDDLTSESRTTKQRKELIPPTVSDGVGPKEPGGGRDKPLASANDKQLPGLIAKTVSSDMINSREAAYLKMNFGYIRKIIARNLTFPASARKRSLFGKIEISFFVGTDGGVEDIRIMSSSGHALLDTNVIAAVRRSAPFPAPPKKARIVLPIVFRLK
jgi:TonB family protein